MHDTPLSLLPHNLLDLTDLFLNHAGYANGRTDFSRPHGRVFAAAINASLSLEFFQIL
jgi:hypothetical protein